MYSKDTPRNPTANMSNTPKRASIIKTVFFKLIKYKPYQLKYQIDIKSKAIIRRNLKQ